MARNASSTSSTFAGPIIDFFDFVYPSIRNIGMTRVGFGQFLFCRKVDEIISMVQKLWLKQSSYL